MNKDIKNEIFYSFSEKISKYGLQHTRKACLNKGFLPNIITVKNVHSIFMAVKRNKGISLTNKESLLFWRGCSFKRYYLFTSGN